MAIRQCRNSNFEIHTAPFPLYHILSVLFSSKHIKSTKVTTRSSNRIQSSARTTEKCWQFTKFNLFFPTLSSLHHCHKIRMKATMFDRIRGKISSQSSRQPAFSLSCSTSILFNVRQRMPAQCLSSIEKE